MKVIEFESSYFAIYFSYTYLTSMEEDYLSIKKVVKNLQN